MMKVEYLYHSTKIQNGSLKWINLGYNVEQSVCTFANPHTTSSKIMKPENLLANDTTNRLKSTSLPDSTAQSNGTPMQYPQHIHCIKGNACNMVKSAFAAKKATHMKGTSLLTTITLQNYSCKRQREQRGC